jgi:chromosomal replication initiator protein
LENVDKQLMSESLVNLEVNHEVHKIWKECLGIIRENVPFITYNTWFIPIKPIEIVESTLKIEVPNNYFVEWIDGHYNTLISSTIQRVIGDDAKLVYVILDEDENPIANDNQSEDEKPVFIEEKAPPKPDFNSNLNPRYLFSNFIEGEGNQLARAASVAISENSGQTSFNPLFLYGGVGLGKTHLSQAIGNRIVKKHPHKRVIYLSSDIFTVEFVEAIQTNKVNDFAFFYKGMDVLIIDDIQFLIGKEKTQDLFFHIFNTLHQSGKQIILTSDKPPKDLKGLNDRLVSRFQWGLTADMQPPDFETRIAILKNKSQSYGIFLPNEIVEYIAYNITSNIREMEGCLIKLLANSSLSGKDIDFDLVKKTVREISTSRQVNISIDYITKVVCEFFTVDENKVREKNRKREVVAARQIAMYLSKKLTKASLKTIGLHFGGRDHSTVIHAYNCVNDSVAKDLKFKETVESLKSKIELSAA